MQQEYASPLLDEAVNQISRLPGIGRKTALRLSLYILRQDPSLAHRLADALTSMRDGIRYCRRCYNISETDICPICANPLRDTSTICVVENIRDVLAFERTAQYHGLYHVLGGVISPIDGVGPDLLEIDSLVQRVRDENTHEVILALSPTMEGETTNYYIYRRLAGTPAKVTQLARGLSVGGDIEYTDEATLARSLAGRIPVGDPQF